MKNIDLSAIYDYLTKQAHDEPVLLTKYSEEYPVVMPPFPYSLYEKNYQAHHQALHVTELDEDDLEAIQSSSPPISHNTYNDECDNPAPHTQKKS